MNNQCIFQEYRVGINYSSRFLTVDYQLVLMVFANADISMFIIMIIIINCDAFVLKMD